MQAIVRGSDGKVNKNIIIPPIVSDPIYNINNHSSIVIHEISDTTAPVNGGKLIILLCAKVNRNEIGLRFVERDRNGSIVWQEHIEQKIVHHQYGIAFKTPAYHNLNIDEPVKVTFELYSLTNEGMMDTREFDLLPIEVEIRKKRKRQRVQDQDYGMYAGKIIRNRW